MNKICYAGLMFHKLICSQQQTCLVVSFFLHLFMSLKFGINISGKPSITRIVPASASITDGENVEFSCYVSGAPHPVMSWKFLRTDIPGKKFIKTGIPAKVPKDGSTG